MTVKLDNLLNVVLSIKAKHALRQHYSTEVANEWEQGVVKRIELSLMGDEICVQLIDNSGYKFSTGYDNFGQIMSNIAENLEG